ncbi:MAG: FecR domain-containing protein [Verrucomicrobia bacterium]|nr:FecR domain-containing protein [Verrucomicrobiota bacterium]
MKAHSFFLILGLALFLPSLPAQTVRVIFVSGHADLQAPSETTPHPASKGEAVTIGTRITTGADGRVVLTPMPGVRSMIAPNTVLVLESVSDSHPSANEVKHQAVLELKVGAVVSDLQKQDGVTYDYSIRTPRGLAGARGTTFTVGLNAAGIQTIVVSHGTITLSLADGRQVSISMGQVSITQANGETQHAAKVSDLSPQDQALAQNWAQTTLETLANAVAAGIDLQPDALSNALSSAESLGIPVPAELKTRVETLIANPPALTTTGDTTATTSTTPPSEVLNQTDTFRDSLTATQQVVFDTLSAEAQQVLRTLNDTAITAVALAPETDTGLILTNYDIIRHGDALITLKQNGSLDFFKTLAGASVSNGSLTYLNEAPDPADWSADAFARSLANWNNLTTTEQHQLITLGASETAMDRSSTYLSALLQQFNSLTSDQQAALASTGWGRYLADLPTDPSLVTMLADVGSLSDAQRATLKLFEFTPKMIAQGSFGTESTFSIDALLTELAGFSSADQLTLRQLGGDALLSAYYDFDSSAADFGAHLTTSLAFYHSLTAQQQAAIRALGAGELLLFHDPADVIGYDSGTQSNITAGDRLTILANFYLGLDTTRQQALRDIGLFRENGSKMISGTGSFDTTQIQNTITAWLALSDRTRNFLSSEGRNYSIFNLANIPTTRTSLISTDIALINGYRTLTQIDTLLAGLSDAQFAALLDLDGAKAVIETGHLGEDALATLKNVLDFYRTQLSASQKATLRELGIVGDDNIAALGADTTGLSRLLSAYAALPGAVRASTERLDEASANGSHFGNSEEIKTRSYFFPYSEVQTTMVNVSFEAAGDLYVGATKYLVIDNTTDSNVTFTTATGKDLVLRASDLIDLTATTFSAGMRTITMEASTINLTNIDFPGGAGVYLNSKLGGTADGLTGTGIYPHFGSSTPGRVNFISGVNYNGTAIDGTAAFDAHGGNIHIGTLANPVVAPAPIVNTPQ